MEDFTGVIIEESLEDKTVLANVKITQTRVKHVTERHKTPWVKQWTMHTVTIPCADAVLVADKISRALDSQHSWYADFENSTQHYIIFRNKIFCIDKSDKKQYLAAKKYGISLGIPEYQVDF